MFWLFFKLYSDSYSWVILLMTNFCLILFTHFWYIVVSFVAWVSLGFRPGLRICLYLRFVTVLTLRCPLFLYICQLWSLLWARFFSLATASRKLGGLLLGFWFLLFQDFDEVTLIYSWVLVVLHLKWKLRRTGWGPP